MADSFNDRYKKAAAQRWMAPENAPVPEAVPTAAAMPPTDPVAAYNGQQKLAEILTKAGLLHPAPPAVTSPTSVQYPGSFGMPSMLTRPPMPQAVSDADYAQPTMAPPPSMLDRPPTQQGPMGTLDRSQFLDANAAPQALPPVGAPASTPLTINMTPGPQVDPRTAGGADMAGYGASPRIGTASGLQSAYLNPTPSLAAVFEQEYAANPQSFDKGWLGRLLGSS